MIWAAMLWSISSYSWYLLIALNRTANHPNPWTGFTGLILVAILPTFLGFTANRSLLATGPTVLKAIGINARDYLLYAGLTVAGGILTRHFLSLPFPNPLEWADYIFPSFWQFISWCYGMHFGINYAELRKADRPAAIKAAEIGLILVVPAIFLLTFAGFPSSSLTMIILCWFIILALALTVEGSDWNKSSVICYDMVVFHAVVPTVVSVILFAMFFLRGTHSLMTAIKRAVIALLGLILHLLELLFSKVPEPGRLNPDILGLTIGMEAPVPVKEPSVWVIALFLVVMLIILIPLVYNLIRWLKVRLHPVSPLPQAPFPSSFLQIIRWLVRLVRNLAQEILNLFSRLRTLVAALQLKLKIMLRRWLPAQTPYQQIVRSYEAFLSLGRKTGCRRRTCETPLEYAQRLEQSTRQLVFPLKEINYLTSLFLEARYSDHLINWQQATECETLVNTIRSTLRRKRHLAKSQEH